MSVIQVYFGPDEDDLYKKIKITAKKMHISNSGWLKLAAEKMFEIEEINEADEKP